MAARDFPGVASFFPSREASEQTEYRGRRGIVLDGPGIRDRPQQLGGFQDRGMADAAAFGDTQECRRLASENISQAPLQRHFCGTPG